MVLFDTKENQKNLSVAWINYAKAYDSVPHRWILHCLETYKFDPNLVNYFKHAMKKWKTQLHLNHTSATITSRTIDINSGIFQGDSPSGLALCISLIPLTWLINKTGLGYYIGKGNSLVQLISHLLFMDDLKLYASNNNQLRSLLETVTDIDMKFGYKCRKSTILK